MSELKAIIATPHLKMKNACDGAIEVYPKCEADNVINELKKELTRTKRALWLARADRALTALEYFTMKCRWFKDYMKIEPPQCDVSMIKKWARVNRKCRAYADKFKE